MPTIPCSPLVLECLVPEGGWRSRGEGEPGDGRAYFPQSVASGEPDAEGVLLWTRAVAPEHPGADVPLRLEVARDEHFRQCVLEARGLRTTSAHDHTLKVRLTRLEPRTHYYYRFVVETEGGGLGSPVGRTRTACARGLPIHFVVASYEELLGQERGGWQRLLPCGEEPDFILFVGPSSWAPGGEAEGEGGGSLHSVSSYRDLHRTYRSHPVLQQLHARYPFIVLWEEERGSPGSPPQEWCRNARRACLEYLPVLDGEEGMETPGPGEPASCAPGRPESSPRGVPRAQACTASRPPLTPPGLRRRAPGRRPLVPSRWAARHS